MGDLSWGVRMLVRKPWRIRPDAESIHAPIIIRCPVVSLRRRFLRFVFAFTVGLVPAVALGASDSVPPVGPTPITRAVDASDEDTSAAFASGRTPFEVRVRDVVSPYRVLGVFVMPGERVPLRVERGPLGGRYTVHATAGVLAPLTNRMWLWTAPQQPGLYPLRVENLAGETSMVLNTFVLTPLPQRQTTLDGYRIGRYRTVALGGRDAYEPPEGLLLVTPENAHVRISPHFTLGQFASRQTRSLPQYVLVKTRLLLKLELILQALNEKGLRTPTLHINSGFRTPYYNASIGARTAYSRHLYGDAADVYVDVDDDGRMDDLNRDGRVSRGDAEWLARVVREVEGTDAHTHLTGGLGVYGRPEAKNPFVHVDTRGYSVRW